MLRFGSIFLMLLILASCRKVDNNRLPPAPVSLTFYTVAEWDKYGVPGALSFRSFIKSERIPADFSYTALSQTGFGGVILCGDIFGAPVAYDLACPVEMKADIRIQVDPETNKAFCPRCKSVYDVFTNYGNPISGEAAENGWGLTRYYVGAGRSGEYMVVTRY